LKKILSEIPETNELLRLGPGKSFGEFALLNDTRRAATILATKDTHFLTVPREEYKMLLEKIERKNQEKNLEFLRNVPYMKKFPAQLAVKL